MAELLKGAPVAEALTAVLTEKVISLKKHGVIPTLAILRVGEKGSDLCYERGATGDTRLRLTASLEMRPNLQ